MREAPSPLPRSRRCGSIAVLSGLLAVLSMGGCGGRSEGGSAGASGARADTTRHELVVFVYDRSGSISDYKLELARELTDRRIAGLTFGDRIAAMEVLQLSLAEPPRRWSQPVPAREFPGQRTERDSVALARFLRDAQIYLRTFSDTANRRNIASTDLLSTLHDVAAEVRGWPGLRPVVYLFSDMLQSNRQVNMETGPVPGRDWVERESRAGTLPDLGGACIMVVGARVDTDRAQRVKAFWMAYFKATNGILLDRNYTLRPVRLPERPCEDAAPRTGEHEAG